MAVERKTKNNTRAKKIESVPKLRSVNSNIPSVITDIPSFREQTRADIAKYIICGLFGILFLLIVLLFLLIYLNRSESSIFKDILLSFIGFSSGLLVAIFGYYYKKEKDIDDD